MKREYQVFAATVVLFILSMVLNFENFIFGGDDGNIYLQVAVCIALLCAAATTSFFFGLKKSKWYPAALTVYFAATLLFALLAFLFVSADPGWAIAFFIIPAFTFYLPLLPVLSLLNVDARDALPLLLIGIVYFINAVSFWTGKSRTARRR